MILLCEYSENDIIIDKWEDVQMLDMDDYFIMKQENSMIVL